MSVNSSALIRFGVYDRCLRNRSKEFTREDIMNELRKEEVKEKKKGVREREGIEINKRQFYNDLKMIESEWEIEILRIRKGKSKIYRYTHPGFSIFSFNPMDSALIKLRDTILVLKQYKGLPSLDFLHDLYSQIEGVHPAVMSSKAIVEFDGNPHLKGLDHFPILLSSIQLKQVLKITYNESFKRIKTSIFSPYFLKEYNNRWFLFCFDNESKHKSITNIPIDRIEQLEFVDEKYVEPTVDFDGYFDDVIGVTVNKGNPIKVSLKFSEKRFPYVISKPLHGSQKPPDIESRTIEIKVIENRELVSLIMSFGDDVEVLEPKSLRNEIKRKVTSMFNNYNQNSQSDIDII